MTTNKQTVHNFMEGFKKWDRAQILSCLTEDIVWDMQGAFHLEGKEAFDRELKNDAFTDNPIISHIKIVEEQNILVAEGTVQSQSKEGQTRNYVFCDVFQMEGGKIKKLTAYVLEV